MALFNGVKELGMESDGKVKKFRRRPKV